MAIIPELEAEIEKGNSDEYRNRLARSLALEKMLNRVQRNNLSIEVTQLIDQWKRERNQLRYNEGPLAQHVIIVCKDEAAIWYIGHYGDALYKLRLQVCIGRIVLLAIL